MNKINGSAIRKVSAENPATAHTRDRCGAFGKINRIKYGYYLDI